MDVKYPSHSGILFKFASLGAEAKICKFDFQNRALVVKSAIQTSSRIRAMLRVRMRKGSLQTKLNAGLSEQQQEDLFQSERSFHEVNSKQHVFDKLTRPPPT